MLYEFRCIEHPEQRLLVIRSWKEQNSWTEGICKKCGQPLELDLNGHGGSWFKLVYGKHSGVYDYDYGKKATWDCTAPGKMEYLKKEGIIRDPFDSGPPPVSNDDIVGDI